MVFTHGITSTLVVYYLATYFQGAKENSAIRSGVLLFPTACIIGKYPFLKTVTNRSQLINRQLPSI